MEVYLDNSATTKPSAAAVAAMERCLIETWHNPSALYKPALTAEKELTRAREDCLAALDAKGERLCFTSCGTEADNLAILGHLRTVKKAGRVLILCVEHPAVLNCADEIKRLGHSVELIPVDGHGIADLTALEAMLDDTVRMICCMQVNNESGAIQPLAEIVKLRDAKCPDVAVHVDGVQGFLRVPISFRKLKLQSYAFSGHKIHGPKGVGALVIRKDFKLNPVLFGGGQEDGFRSGTENMPGILGMAEAVRTYPSDGAEKMMHIKRMLWDALKAAVPQAELNGPSLEDEACAPHILNVSFPPVRSQTMLFALEGDGIYVSNGSACSSRKQKLSGVLSAMKLPADRIDSALRFSLCPDVTEEQVAYVAACVKKQYELLHKFVRR